MGKLYILIAVILLILVNIYINYNKKEGFDTNLKLCFYTCFYGSDSNKAFNIPPIPSNKYKCFYYTNNKLLLEKLKESKWIGVYDNVITQDDIIESCMAGKKPKVLPHTYKELNEFDYTCFYDSKFGLINEIFLEIMINKYLIQENYALLVREHPFIKGDIFHEFNESMLQDRYIMQKDQYTTYINKQLDNGLNKITKTHATCCVLIRNMKHPKIKDINNTWYKHIEECGIQDQISFFFIKQLYKDVIYIFNESPCKNTNLDWRCNNKESKFYNT
jgi:hypothetical protein